MFIIVDIFHSLICWQTILVNIFVLEETHFFQFKYSCHQFVILDNIILLPKESINYLIFNGCFWNCMSTMIIIEFISQVRVLEWIHSSWYLVFLVVPISVASLLGGLYSMLPLLYSLLSLWTCHLNHILQREGCNSLGAHLFAVSHFLSLILHSLKGILWLSTSIRFFASTASFWTSTTQIPWQTTCWFN